ncbi:hypothetical protein PCANC_09533 [Puccinia coronata f. sp. avenae]|uniref:Uncharacterized protein n=1 Tax=Puccinia coronata f. sp. avenae TaxID=200324 RepID=A0A2N5V4X9_9BASI|nr:hypothetical protein PCANC_09533 [Puccinia coronata f. sp. avenae]
MALRLLGHHHSATTSRLPHNQPADNDSRTTIQMLSQPQVIQRSTSGASVVTSPKAPGPAPGASVVTAPKAPGPAPVAEQAQREHPHKKP